MSPRLLLGLFLILVLVTTGCQKKNDKRVSLRDRRARSGFADQQNASNQTNNTCHSQALPGKLTGEVTSSAGDNAFWAELYYLTYPVLGHLEDEADQLGFVSSRSNQSTGVRFWGNAETANGSGTGAINPATAEIRLEIFDDRACQPKPDGETRPIVPIHIKQGFKSYKVIQGQINGGRAYLHFEDAYGAIIMDGSITGTGTSAWYSGTMSYTLTGYNGARTLGTFKVPACGFFRCR